MIARYVSVKKGGKMLDEHVGHVEWDRKSFAWRTFDISTVKKKGKKTKKNQKKKQNSTVKNVNVMNIRTFRSNRFEKFFLQPRANKITFLYFYFASKEWMATATGGRNSRRWHINASIVVTSGNVIYYSNAASEWRPASRTCSG
ncbi:hypothetical protein PUN28_003258 [Cardiocondyla obscurior]|uniref:Uncharacterized protein n=1 Tax=Cardiocondyla obscurior TaxID=286306 RepID=A0AAW2GJM3_9HYME